MKKSQLKMAETIAILFVFFILIIIGVVVYGIYQRFTLKKTAEEIEESQIVNIAKNVPFLAEIRCPTAAREVTNCIDISKLQAFKEFIKESVDNPKIRSHYLELLGNSNLTVIEIYPDATHNPINFYDSYTEYTGYKTIFVPVSLYFAETDKYGLGTLSVVVYQE